MKRFLIISLILITIIGLSVVGYRYASPAAEPATVAEDPNVEVASVEREALTETVNATGQLKPKSEVEMKFETGGVVDEVLVQRGQYVTAGTPLARLDTEELALAVERADIDLAKAEAELEHLLEPEPAEKIESARAKIESARLKLEELRDGPDEDEITKAASALQQKEIELQQAQWDYDQVAYKGDIGARGEARELEQATLEYESALADYNIAVKAPTAAELAEAGATLAEARSSLAELMDGPSAAEVAISRSAIDTAELALREARRDLNQAVLLAPTDGILLSVDVEPGERVFNEADNAAMIIADTSAYLLEVAVDEIDIGTIEVGQTTEIILDAFSDETFEGEVVDIAPSPLEDESSGVVTFEVVISIDTAEQTAKLLPGMTATAAIVTDEFPGALVIPNQAIQVDRTSTPSKVFVEKLDENGDVMRVEVELGLRNGPVTQVTGGVEEGDEIIIRTQPLDGPEPNI